MDISEPLPASIPAPEAAELEELELGSDEPAADSESSVADAESKLDLATVYAEIGDPDAARMLVEEVLQTGDERQRAQAREIAEKIGA